MVRKLATGFVLALLGPATAHAQARVEATEREVSGVSVRVLATTGSAKIGLLPIRGSAELQGEVPKWYRINHPKHGPGLVSESWTRIITDLQNAPGSQFDVYLADVATGLVNSVRGEKFDLVYEAGSKNDLTRNRFLDVLDEVLPGTASIDHVHIKCPQWVCSMRLEVGYYSSMQYQKHGNVA